MLSSFEPCGISQMLAISIGQPCLVHSVGGLSDTITDDLNGFSFTGGSLQNQAQNMDSRFKTGLELRHKKPEKWA